MSTWKQPQEAKEVQSSLAHLRKDALGYIPAIVVPAALNLLSLMLFTRLFQPDEYGVYTLLLSTVTIVTIIGAQWIVQALQRYRPQYQEQQRLPSFNRNLLRMLYAISLAFVVLAMPGYVVVRYFLHAYLPYFAPSFLLMWTQALYMIGISLFQSDARVKDYRLFQVAASVLKFGLSLAWLYGIEFSVSGLLWGAVAANLALLVPLYRKTGVLSKLTSSAEQDESVYMFFRKFFSFGVPMIGWFLATSVLDACDRFFLELYRASEEVGIYAANYSLSASIVGVMTLPLMSAVHPIVMRAKSDGEVKLLIDKFSRIYILLTAPIWAICVVYSNDICSVLLGDRFAEGSFILPVLVLGFSVWYCSFIGHKGYEYKQKTKVMFGFISFSALINIALNLVLIPRYGYAGAAYATLCGFLAYALCVYAYSGRYIPWTVSPRFMAKLAALVTVTTAAAFGFRYALPVATPHLVSIAAGSVLLLLLYAAGLLLIGEASLSQWKQVAARFRKKA